MGSLRHSLGFRPSHDATGLVPNLLQVSSHHQQRYPVHLRVLSLSVLSLSCASVLRAQTATAFKTGERVTGQTKQCYYKFAGTDYTKTVQSFELCPLNVQVRTGPAENPSPTAPPRSGATAFKTGEERTGQTKQCFYAFAGKRFTNTVQSFELCPLSIEVP